MFDWRAHKIASIVAAVAFAVVYILQPEPAMAGIGALAGWLAGIAFAAAGGTGAAGAGLTVAGIAYAATYAAVYIGATALIGTALSFAAQAIFKPNGPPPISVDISRLRHVQRGTAEPGRVIYGTVVASGVLAYANVTNQDGVEKKGGQYLHFALPMAVGPISRISHIYFNDRLANEADFSDRVVISSFLGHEDQKMIRGPVEMRDRTVKLPEDWLEDDRPFKRTAGVFVSARFSIDEFARGAPSVRAQIDGRLLYDPREDDTYRSGNQTSSDPHTHTFTRNSALCVLDFLTNPDYGMGIPLSRIDVNSVMVAADVCDEPCPTPARSRAREKERRRIEESGRPLPDYVPVETNETEPRYETDGLFQTDAQPIDILAQLCAAMAGTCFFFQGKWYIFAGHDQGVSTWPAGIADGALAGNEIHIQQQHVRSDASITALPKPGKKDRVNTMLATFPDPASDYQPVTTGEISQESFVVEDNGRVLIKEADFPMTASLDRAIRLATIRLRETRLGSRIKVPLMPSMAFIAPWSIVRLTLPNWGIGVDGNGDPVAQYFRVLTVTTDPTRVGPEVELIRYDSTIYDNPESTFEVKPVSGLGDPFDVRRPSRATAVEKNRLLPDGTKSSAIRLEIWPSRRDQNLRQIDGFRVRWKNIVDTEANWNVQDVPLNSTDVTGVFEFPNLERGWYAFKCYAVSGGTESREAYTVTGHVTYVTDAPRGPHKDAAVRQLADSSERIFQWFEYGADPDTTAYEVLYREDPDGTLGVDPAAEIGSATFLGSVPFWQYSRVIDGEGNKKFRIYEYRTDVPKAAGDYMLYVRSVDNTGQYSTGIATVRFTVLEASDSTRLRREFADSWLSGTLIDCKVSRDNQLVGKPKLTWRDLQEDNPTTTWGENASSELTWISPIIEMEDDAEFGFVFDAEVNEDTEWFATVRTKTDEEGAQWTTWRERQARVAKYAQFRLHAISAAGRPAKVRNFAVELKEKLDFEIQEDINTADLTSLGKVGNLSARIEESTRGQWLAGEQDGCSVERVAVGNTRTYAVACNMRPTLVHGSGTNCAVPHIASYNFHNSFTLGATVMFDTPASAIGTVDIVKKGTAYGIQYIGGTGFKFVAAGYTGDDPSLAPAIEIESDDPDGGRFYDITFTYDGSVLRGFCDGVLNFEHPCTFSLATVATDVTFGGNGFLGPMREVHGWNVALSPEDVSQFVNIGYGRDNPSLQFYFKLDEGPSYRGGTVLRDSSKQRNDGVITLGSGAWEAVGWRQSPDIDLQIFCLYKGVLVGWSGSQPSGTSATVQFRVVDDSDMGSTSYTTVSQVTGTPEILAVLTNPRLNGGKRLQCRQILRSTNLTAKPYVDKITYGILYDSVVGAATILTQKKFQRLDQAAVVGIQGDGTGSAQGSAVFHTKSRHGARFTFTDANGDPSNPVVDVRFEGTLFGR